MSSKRDAALVQKALAGDEGAFEALLHQVEPDLRGFMSWTLSGRPDASVDEALQELRIYLYRRLDRYDPQYPFAAFARGLAKNITKRFLFKKSDLAPSGFDADDDSHWTNDLSPLELQDLPVNLQAVLGGARFAPPEGLPPPSRVFLEMLELLFRYGGYPHQQVSFGFSILLWGKQKAEPRGRDGSSPVPFREKVPVTGDPDRVVREVGPDLLDRSCAAMLQELQGEIALEDSYLERISRPVFGRLAMTAAELFSLDGTSRRLFANLEVRRVGLTRLREYFGKDGRRSVADWTRTVRDRIRKVLVDPAARDRIPLPHP